MTDPAAAWHELLTPEVARGKLISASLYISAFELLKDCIVSRVREFYCIGADGNGPMISERYRDRVLSRNRSALQASLDWLQESGAVSPLDIELFEELKAVRNTLAHELHHFVMGEAKSLHVERFADVVKLLRKIEVWWIVNVELATDPDYDGSEIDEEQVVPGPILVLQMMVDVIAGNTEYLRAYNSGSKGRAGGA